MKNCLFYLISGYLSLTCPFGGSLLASSPASVSQENQKNQDAGIVFFTPPPGWHYANANDLPPSVKVMVIGKAPTKIPPTINLSCEPRKDTLKQYLKIVKNINAAHGDEWKNLGPIQTQSGTANLSQVDVKTQWGILRNMHVITVKNGYAYILTASALKDEFSMFYKDFFASLRSLKISKDLYESIANPQQRAKLKAAAEKLKTDWNAEFLQAQNENPGMDRKKLEEAVFNSVKFQNTFWNPFKEMLSKNSDPLGPEWNSFFLKIIENQLKEQNPI